MAEWMYPKDYIRHVLIDEIRDVMHSHAYLGFALTCTGIDFLGRCIDHNVAGWHQPVPYGAHFISAIRNLFPKHYDNLAPNLYNALRNGMVHAQLPKQGYWLTELKNTEDGPFDYTTHLVTNKKLVVAEYFFQDFESAGNTVISMTFPASNKMNRRFLKTRR
jgi:hypothetical protein